MLFAFSFMLNAEQFGGFLENIYDEIAKLNLNQTQRVALTETIKNHHNFLRKWYVDMKANSEQMMQKFANSTLTSDAAEFARGEKLSHDRIIAEYHFMMSVYEILDNQQRKSFSAKIKSKALLDN